MIQMRGAAQGRSWRLALTLVCLLLVSPGWETQGTAVTSVTGKEFWYWDGDLSLAENGDHVSLTQLVTSHPDAVAARLQALPPTLKALVPAGLLGSDGCSLRPDWQQHWSDMVAKVRPHLGKIAAFLLDDEPDNRAVTHCFQHDPSMLGRQTRMAQLVQTMSAIVKSSPSLPNVRTWVNYGLWWLLTPGTPLAQNVDWNGFDCYGPFDNCFGSGYSIPQIVELMSARLPNWATQWIVPIADASCFRYDNLGLQAHESELFMRALQYWQLAKTHPRVKGLVGFLWNWGGNPHPWLSSSSRLHDINDSPGLATLYRHIGLNLTTGFVPAPSSKLTTPAECRIAPGGTTCNVALSWTQASGPYVGVFARPAGQFGIVHGPLCPGGTACALPAAVGDYVVELREYWWDPNSKLIDAAAIEVRHGSGAPTGQITFTPSNCYRLGASNCDMVLTANTQNAPGAGFFLVGLPFQICGNGGANFCAVGMASWQFPPGVYTATVQLRVNRADPGSPLLDQRTFSFTVHS